MNRKVRGKGGARKGREKGCGKEVGVGLLPGQARLTNHEEGGVLKIIRLTEV